MLTKAAALCGEGLAEEENERFDSLGKFACFGISFSANANIISELEHEMKGGRHRATDVEVLRDLRVCLKHIGACIGLLGRREGRGFGCWIGFCFFCRDWLYTSISADS